MPENTWQFPENLNRKRVGFNNQGAAHFTGDRFQNVIRETVQNSLDAVADHDTPVTISIRQEDLDVDHIGGESLLRHIKASVSTSKVPHDKPHLESLLAYMEKSVQAGSIPTLIISEDNTTGASDIPQEEDGASMWEALTNAEGVDVKASADSGGSHGIGKNAPYTISVPRTVLYSTNFKTSNNKASKSLFIGRSMLVSHEEKETHYSHEGYLGDTGFNALEDGNIHPRFRKESPGLDLYIVGFQVPEEKDWRRLATAAAITNFFHSIIKGKVVFDISGVVVNANNIMEKAKEIASIDQDSLDEETLNFMVATTQGPIETISIDGIGQVNLYLTVYEDPERTQREVAIVRDSGMLITDQLSRMNLRGMRRESSFPRQAKGFTAIIECLSPDHTSLLKDSESTSHDEIRTDNIIDQVRRRQADRQLGKLATWVKAQLREKTHREITSRVGEANELNKYISLEGEADPAEGSGAPQFHITITPPKLVTSGVSPFQSRSRRLTNVIVPGGSGSGGGAGGGGGGGVRTPTKKKLNRRVLNQPHIFGGLRMARKDVNSTHSLIVTFDDPGRELTNVKLVTVGEDGSEKPVGLQATAKVNGKTVSTKNDAIRTLKPQNGTNRVVMEFHTREPVTKNGQSLKSFYLKSGEASK